MKDITGLDATAHYASTIELYNSALRNLCAYTSPMSDMLKMLEAEPDFVMGHVFSAHLNLLTLDRDDKKWALDSYGKLIKIGERNMNSREKMHVHALEAWVQGDLIGASRRLDNLLVEFPTDMLAIFSGHQIDFNTGDATTLRDRIYRVMPSWEKDHPLYGYLLGMVSVGQEEAGQYELSEQTALEAVARNPYDVWGIHSVAHAFEMQGKFTDGDAFMTSHEKYWGSENFLLSHNSIHHGLFLLEMGDISKAVKIYDEKVQPKGSDPVPVAMLDGSSVLWRLYLEGGDLGGRERTLSDNWRTKSGQLFHTFIDVHAMLSFAMSGDDEAAIELIDGLRRYVEDGDRRVTNHMMTATTGLPACEAIYSFSKGDYQAAIEKLWPIRTTNGLMGGSHAQRDVLARTLLESAIRSGNKSLAKALVNERLMSRPLSPYNLKKMEQVNAIQ